jgi:hypothetical protein
LTFAEKNSKRFGMSEEKKNGKRRKNNIIFIFFRLEDIQIIHDTEGLFDDVSQILYLFFETLLSMILDAKSFV